jgi:predicted ATPase
MRVDKLEIKSEWKNLEGFKIDFDESRDVAVIIGKNGASKSNLLETLIRIFRDIDLKLTSDFAYSIIYRIGKDIVRVETEVDKRAKGFVNDKPVTQEELRTSWTPRYVVGYYSGTSDRFQELFLQHDKIALDQTLEKGKKKVESLAFRRFTLARPVHGLFALLAFYLSEDKQVVDFLRDFPRIEAFDSTLLILHEPDWAKPGAKAEDFWGAKGPVRKLLESFRSYSLAPFIHQVPKEGSAGNAKKEVMYLYLPDLKNLHLLAKEYGQNPREFFQALDTMRLSRLIDDFKVKVRIKGTTKAVHTRQLSEGEQQLLTVLGLMRFTQDEESLYLLDEPDTHLNPSWGLEYLDRLRSIGGINKHSHTILATHDPLLVAGLLKQEIRVLMRNTKGRVIAIEPEESPRGTGVANVLTSQLYGLESQLDNFSLKVLKRIYEVSMMENYPLRERHLARLNKLAPDLAPTDSYPDPYKNIAKVAYEKALEAIVSSENSDNWKDEATERVTSFLYEK